MSFWEEYFGRTVSICLSGELGADQHLGDKFNLFVSALNVVNEAITILPFLLDNESDTSRSCL
jgi:hypothetical protein